MWNHRICRYRHRTRPIVISICYFSFQTHMNSNEQKMCAENVRGGT